MRRKRGERKKRKMDKHCKLCKEPLPPFALHFSNTVAIEEGYCSYFCMLSALEEEKALKVLQKYPEKMRIRKQEGRSQERSRKSIHEK